MDMLEPSANEIRDRGDSVTEFMIDYLGGLRDRTAYRRTSSPEIRGGLDPALPIEGTDFDSLLKVFRETIIPSAVRTRTRGCLATCNRLGLRWRRSPICLLRP